LSLEELEEVFKEYKNRGGRLELETLSKHVEETRPILIEAARNRKTITYGELTKKFRICRGDIGRLLGAISIIEHRQNRPLLSSVVINKITGNPGVEFLFLPGIQETIKRVGGQKNPILHYYNEGEEKFWKSELEKTWDYWQK